MTDPIFPQNISNPNSKDKESKKKTAKGNAKKIQIQTSDSDGKIIEGDSINELYQYFKTKKLFTTGFSSFALGKDIKNRELLEVYKDFFNNNKPKIDIKPPNYEEISSFLSFYKKFHSLCRKQFTSKFQSENERTGSDLKAFDTIDKEVRIDDFREQIVNNFIEDLSSTEDKDLSSTEDSSTEDKEKTSQEDMEKTSQEDKEKTSQEDSSTKDKEKTSPEDRKKPLQKILLQIRRKKIKEFKDGITDEDTIKKFKEQLKKKLFKDLEELSIDEAKSDFFIKHKPEIEYVGIADFRENVRNKIYDIKDKKIDPTKLFTAYKESEIDLGSQNIFRGFVENDKHKENLRRQLRDELTRAKDNQQKFDDFLEDNGHLFFLKTFNPLASAILSCVDYFGNFLGSLKPNNRVAPDNCDAVQKANNLSSGAINERV